MKSIVVAGGVGTLADFDDVLAIGRGDDRSETILQRQRRVIVRGQFETFLIQNRDVRIEHRRAQPHRDNLDRDSLSLFRLDHEVVDVFVADVSVDDVPQRNGLWCCEVAVRFHFVHDGQVFDVQRAIIGNAGGGTNLRDVFAESAVRGNTYFYFRIVPIPFDLQHLQPAVVKEDVLSIAKIGTVEGQLVLDPTLNPARSDAGQTRRRGLQIKRDAGQQRQGESESKQKRHTAFPSEVNHFANFLSSS